MARFLPVISWGASAPEMLTSGDNGQGVHIEVEWLGVLVSFDIAKRIKA